MDVGVRGATEGDATPGETLGETGAPGGLVAVQPIVRAAIAAEMRSFVVTGTSRTLFLEWLT